MQVPVHDNFILLRQYFAAEVLNILLLSLVQVLHVDVYFNPMWLVFPDWCADILENCLFMLWRHLEYYLIHCVPVTQQSSLYQTQARRQTQLRRLQGQSRALKQSL